MFNKREYKVSTDDDWVKPEETLLDSISDYSDLEFPISDTIFRGLFLITAVLSVAVMFFIFNLSVVRHDELANIAFQNRSVNFSVPPPRGIIFDRLGKQLVKNEPVFDLLVVSKEVGSGADLEAEKVSELAKVLGKSEEEFNEFISANAKTNSVFFTGLGLDKDQVLKIKYLSPRGFYIVPNTKRYYIDGSQFSHVIGYIGKVNKDELANDSYYYPTDVVGRLGIEAKYENYLRGKHGQIFFQADENNFSRDSVIGDSLVLNIDYQIQKHLFNELFNVVKDTKYSRAAAVVQDPKTGAVLAMMSFPNYDNNLFVGGLSGSQFANLFESKSRPLFNRAVSGLYNPGSTIKPLMGLMTLQENIFKPSDTIQNCVGLTVVNPYNQDDSYTFNNWRVEYGPFNLKKAIANSCNVYFFIAGGGYGNIKGLGIERIANYLKSTLADSKLGIDLPAEANGFVPTPEWKLSARGENWYQGDTYNTSIGQGDLLVTPLWLNSYISAVANKGTIYKPMIAKQILDHDKNVIQDFGPEAIGRLNFREDVISEVRNAMAETVISGTAKLLSGLPVKVGAKTGTAEVIKGRAVNSIMTAFAPFDEPELSITVLIEGESTNQGLAIRTVNGFLGWYFREYRKSSSYSR
ncbi:MAG: hypothetical protein HYZ69_03955 [Candidatus Colwellbacteria bacterium]|nr:hypothetical protein [Candidatus Colwellbacteria bacterium]